MIGWDFKGDVRLSLTLTKPWRVIQREKNFPRKSNAFHNSYIHYIYIYNFKGKKLSIEKVFLKMYS